MNRYIRAIAAATLLCAPASQAEVLTAETTTYQVRRGSTNVPPMPTTAQECIDRARDGRALEGETRTSGASDHQCITTLHFLGTFRPNRCPALPPPQGKVVDCPDGTTGAYTQTKSWTAAPHPICAVEGEWVPTTPPASCVPIDTDTDGVPDSTDECPTVHATTPNGCPATPPNRAPTIAGSAPVAGTVGQLYTFAPNAADPDGDPLTFEVIARPPWTGWTFDTETGRMSGTPNAVRTHVGIRIAVSDGQGGTAELPLPTITISAAAPAPVNCAVSAWSAWNGGTWTECSNGSQALTETRTRTVTTQPAHGGTACPTLTETRTSTQSCGTQGTGQAVIRWSFAQTNAEGFRIVYGRSATELTSTVQVNGSSARAYTVTGLAPGTYFLAVRTYNESVESVLSNIVSKVIR